ncbi:MAG TPA: hypothetical protein VH020_13975 [Stellaceae bacterium]|jgi:hypothetical protein|nr:hypothetical protein [Stellaceae bacterium]
MSKHLYQLDALRESKRSQWQNRQAEAERSGAGMDGINGVESLADARDTKRGGPPRKRANNSEVEMADDDSEREEIMRALQQDADADGEDDTSDDTRPPVFIVAGELPRAVDQTEQALIARDDKIFKQANRIVTPIWDDVKTHAGPGKTLRLSEVSLHNLLERFSASARFYKATKTKSDKQWVKADCPENLAKAYIARDGAWQMRALLAVVTAPTLRPDGTILDKPGYDDATGILFDPCADRFPQIPERPTMDQAVAALALLKEPIRDFPFVGPADRSVALSAITTAVVRLALPTAPMHAFNAPEAGTGKGLLIDIASMIATGERVAITSEGKDGHGDPELEKRLVASMLAGDRVIGIDNIEGAFGNPFLCSLLTQQRFKLRPLGKSVQTIVPNTFALFANGNNMTIIGDMARRTLQCDLDARVERPELRRFDFEPVEFAKARRGEMVVAVLTIVRAWLTSGAQSAESPLGSYEEWSRMVREPLIWLGEQDPVESIEKIRKGDPKLAKRKFVTAALVPVIGPGKDGKPNDGKLVRDLIAEANKLLPPPDNEAYVYPALRDALLSVADKGGAISSEKLGWWLRKNQKRVIGLDDGRQCKIEGEGGERGRWKIIIETAPTQGLIDGSGEAPF